MAPVTEIVYLSLKPGSNPSEADSPAGSIWKDSVNTVKAQPGFQRAYWSLEVENASMLRFFVDWDSIDDHEQFMKSETYKPFNEHLDQILDGGPTVYHASMTPHPPSAALSNASSPVTEWLTLYTSATDTSAHARLEHDAQELVTIIQQHGDGYVASAGGWVIEELPLPHDPSTKAKAWVAAVGWKSVEHHHTYTETKKDKYGHLLAGATYLQGMTVCHVSGTEVQK